LKNGKKWTKIANKRSLNSHTKNAAINVDSAMIRAALEGMVYRVNK